MAFAATPLKNVTLFDSAARTADENSASINNYAYRGVQVMVNVSALNTAQSATGTFTIQGYDELSDNWFTVLASAAKSATGFFTLTVYPGITASANVSGSTVLPKKWRLNFDISATTNPSVTFSASATLLP